MSAEKKTKKKSWCVFKGRFWNVVGCEGKESAQYLLIIAWIYLTDFLNVRAEISGSVGSGSDHLCVKCVESCYMPEMIFSALVNGTFAYSEQDPLC